MNGAVGFIGLGRMGRAICQRLISHRIQLIVHNRSEDKSSELVRQGALWVPEIRSVARAANIIFVCSSGHQAVEQIYHDKNTGLLANVVEGSIVVDLSTIAPETAIALHAAFRARGADFIECPVSGGVEGALKGALSAIVSARPAAYSIVRPLLAAFTLMVTFVEVPGKAQRLKILNNLAESINLAGAIEVISQGQALGLDLESMQAVFSTCRGRSAYMQVAMNYALSQGGSSSVSLAVRCKDLDLAQQQMPIGPSYPLSTVAMATFHDLRLTFGDEGDQCLYFSRLSTGNAGSAS
ncbi:NAD(P)-dependent oxidoreductase [Pseudomonas putida]|nr:NAD(P)-dependent oxidoreductase [Pseudomonas putida]